MAAETELERMVVRIVGDVSSYLRSLTDIKQNTVDTLNSISNEITRFNTLTGAATSGIMAMGAAIGGLATKSSGMFNKFEFEMSRIEGLVGISHKQVQAWSQDLLRMAPELGKAPEELAKGLFFVTSGGLRGKAALDALAASAKGSAVGLGEVKVVANAVKGAVNAYTKQGMDAAKATDIITATIREGKLETTGLANTIGRILPMAAAMEVDFEDVAGAMAVMSRTGMNAAEAATSIRSVFTSLQAPTKKTLKLFEEARLDPAMLRNMLKEEGGIVKVMRVLEQSFDKNSNAMRLLFPNIRAATGAYNILAQDASVVDKIMKNVRNSVGSTDQAFQVTANTGAFQLEQTTISLKVAMIELGKIAAQVVMPAMRFVLSISRRVTEAFNNLSDDTKKLIAFFGSMAVVIGSFFGTLKGLKVALAITGGGGFLKAMIAPLTIVTGLFGQLAKLVAIVLSPIKLIGPAIAFILNPLGVIIKVVTVFASVFFGIGKVVQVVAMGIMQVMIFIVGLLNPLHLIKTLFSGINTLLASSGFLLGKLVSIFLTIINPVKIFTTLISGVGALIGLILSPMVLLVVALTTIAAITYNWVQSVGGVSKAWEEVKKAAEAAWEWTGPIREELGYLWEAIKEAGSEAFGLLGKFALEVWESISGGATINWEVVRETIITTIQMGIYGLKNFRQIAEFVWTDIQYGFVRMSNTIVYFFEDVLPALFSWFKENWRDIFQTAFNFTTTVIGNLASNIVRVITNIPKLLKGKVTFSELWTPLTEGFENTIKRMPKIPDRVAGEIETRLKETRDSMQQSISEGFDAFKQEHEARKEADRALKRLKEMGPFKEDESEKKTKDIGKSIATYIADPMKKARKEVERFEATLVGSAEAASKIQAYRDMVSMGPTAGLIGPQTGLKRFDAAAVGSAEASQRISNASEGYLKRLVELQEINNRKKPVVIEDSDTDDDTM